MNRLTLHKNDSGFCTIYSVYWAAPEINAIKSSFEQDFAKNFSPAEKKKNAPEAPPSMRRSLIEVVKALEKKMIRKKLQKTTNEQLT